METITIVMAVYPGVTHLDFTGPHQFFSRVPGARVVVASMQGQSIAADGLTFAGLGRLEDQSTCDVLCVPGGSGCTETFETPGFLDAVRRLAAGARFVTSVCTGSLILGAAGLLKGRRAACHWAWRELLIPFGAIPDPGRIVQDGNLITGGGVTAGIDFALVVIAKMAGVEVAQSIQLGLEYAPQPPYSAGDPHSAPRDLVEGYLRRLAPTLEKRRASVDRWTKTLP